MLSRLTRSSSISAFFGRADYTRAAGRLDLEFRSPSVPLRSFVVATVSTGHLQEGKSEYAFFLDAFSVPCGLVISAIAASRLVLIDDRLWRARRVFGQRR